MQDNTWFRRRHCSFLPEVFRIAKNQSIIFRNIPMIRISLRNGFNKSLYGMKQSSLTGIPGNTRRNDSFHLQQLSIIIPSRREFSTWKRSFKSANILETSLKFSDLVNCHWITFPFSLRMQNTELYNLIHLPSLDLLYPMLATLLNVWSHDIHLAGCLDIACANLASCILHPAT